MWCWLLLWIGMLVEVGRAQEDLAMEAAERMQLAFDYAHELDAFWDTQLTLGSAPNVRKHDRMMKNYEQRWNERASK